MVIQCIEHTTEVLLWNKINHNVHKFYDSPPSPPSQKKPPFASFNLLPLSPYFWWMFWYIWPVYWPVILRRCHGTTTRRTNTPMRSPAPMLMTNVPHSGITSKWSTETVPKQFINTQELCLFLNNYFQLLLGGLCMMPSSHLGCIYTEQKRFQKWNNIGYTTSLASEGFNITYLE